MPHKQTLTDAQLESLAAIGLSDKELSSLQGVSESSFKTHYTSPLKRGRARLRQSLRRAQIKSALSGNATMLIFLGKCYLNQRDASTLDLNAERKAISLTPGVLERLQHSYKLSMEEVRTRRALSDAPKPTREAGGVPGTPHPLSKTTSLCRCEDFQLRCT